MSNTLYRKYRPQTFADVIGQKHIIKTITNALKHDRLGQAYLFTGPRGTGKTTTARLLAKAVTCSNRNGIEPCLKCPHCLAMASNSSLDVIEIDAASNTGVDNIRELRDSIKLLPTQATFKVYIIDEVHMLSIGAFNALLKTLEEPPKHVIFILATTSLHKVPETILSRCQRFDFSRLPLDHIIEKLTGIAKSEGVTIDASALEMIALAAEGGMRDAESLLMQVISLEDKDITADEVSSILGITDQQKVTQLIEHITNRDTTQALSLINHIVDNGADLYIFTNSLLHTLRQMLIISIDSHLIAALALEMTQEHTKTLANHAQLLTTAGIVSLIELLQTARKEIRLASIPQLPLEIAIIKCIIPSSIPAPQVQTIPSHTPPTTPASQTTTPIAKVAVPKPVTKSASQPASIPTVVLGTKTAPESASEPVDAIAIDSSITVDAVKQHWMAIIDKTREFNSSLSRTLENCQPLRIEDGTVVLGAKFAMYKDKINLVENKLTVESAFGTILKSKVKVRVVIDESISLQKPSGFAAPTNPIITEAMNILGGNIVS